MKREIKWLYDELPELVEKDIVSPQTAVRLREYYGAPDEYRGGRAVFSTALGILGSVLVGLGIILILAHNWDNITRFNRLLLVTGMLAASQLLTGAVIWRKSAGLAWREGAGTLQLLMVGAAIALVGQTYHLADDTGAYILTWMLLALPLVYLLDALIPALLYLAGITVWTAYGRVPVLGVQLIWLLYALIAPYGWHLLKDGRFGNRAIIWTWTAVVSCYFSFGAAFFRFLGNTWPIVYAALFTAAYLAGTTWFAGSGRGWKNPLRFTGMAGLIGLAFMLTFKSCWHGLKLSATALQSGELLLALAVPAFAAGLGYIKLKRYGKSPGLLEGVLAVIIAGYLLQAFLGTEIVPAILMNAYMFVLGLAAVLRGVRENRLGTLNAGMLVLAGLIFARFMDVQFSFAIRGAVFVLLGLSFLTANLITARRRRRCTNDKT